MLDKLYSFFKSKKSDYALESYKRDLEEICRFDYGALSQVFKGSPFYTITGDFKSQKNHSIPLVLSRQQEFFQKEIKSFPRLLSSSNVDEESKEIVYNYCSLPERRDFAKNVVFNSSVVDRFGGGSSLDMGTSGLPDSLMAHATLITQMTICQFLYLFSAESKKIINIPIEDQLKNHWIYANLTEKNSDKLIQTEKRIRLLEKLRIAMRYEALFGGGALFLGIRGDRDLLEEPIDFDNLKSGDLEFVNPVPRYYIVRQDLNYSDPTSPKYDNPSHYQVFGRFIHSSRIIPFYGDRLNDGAVGLYTGLGSGITLWDGFSPPLLGAVYDDIYRAMGTRQAFYNTIKKNGGTMIKTNMALMREGNAQRKAEMVRALTSFSNNQPVFLDQKDSLEQVSAPLAGLGEAMINQMQILASLNSISSIRFLEAAPGGLNSNAERELENYYSRINALQKNSLEPKLEKLISILAKTELGIDTRENPIKIEFESLWNLSDLERSQVRSELVTTLTNLEQDGSISKKAKMEEINASKLFLTRFDVDALSGELVEQGLEGNEINPFENAESAENDHHQQGQEAATEESGKGKSE